MNESFTLTFRGHSNHGYNVYGYGENRFGKNEIVGTVTQSGKMEIFKVVIFGFVFQFFQTAGLVAGAIFFAPIFFVRFFRTAGLFAGDYQLAPCYEPMFPCMV